MKVFEIPERGFCFGVKRSIDIANQAVKENNTPVYTYGPLIHNPQVVRQLEEDGVIPIESLEGVNPGKLIIRSHGVPGAVMEEAIRFGFSVVDATCPFVKRVQEYAKKLCKEGYEVIVVGEREHPEVQGILGHVEGKAFVLANLRGADEIPYHKRLGIVAQTTLSVQSFVEIVSQILKRAEEVRIYNTICKEVISRQQHTIELAKRVDLMIVIGGRNSANTGRLAELARESCETYQVETDEELCSEWFRNKLKAGVVAGASTPDWIIDCVIREIKLLNGGKNGEERA